MAMMRVTVPSTAFDLDARKLALAYPMRKLKQWEQESDACISLETTEEDLLSQFRWRETLRQAMTIRHRKGLE